MPKGSCGIAAHFEDASPATDRDRELFPDRCQIFSRSCEAHLPGRRHTTPAHAKEQPFGVKSHRRGRGSLAL